MAATTAASGQLAQRDEAARHGTVGSVQRVVGQVLVLVCDAELEEEAEGHDKGR